MKNELSGEYLRDYSEIEKYLKKHIQKGEKLEEALSDLYEMYSDLEADGAEISSVHEGTAEEYAKELAENLPEKEKLFSSKAVFIAVVLILVLAALVFIKNGPLARNHGISGVAENPEKYNLVASEGTYHLFRLFKYGDNDKISTGITNEIASDFIDITECDFSDPELIRIEGQTKSFFNREGNGQIYIPVIYTHIYWNSPEKVLELITDFDESDIRIISGISTNSEIILPEESIPEGRLYYAKPINYQINSDGSVDFAFIFEKTESRLNKKSLSQYIDEGEEVYIVLDCISFEWNSDNPLY